MKKIEFFGWMIAASALALAGCASTSVATSDGRATKGGMPAFVKSAVNGVESSVLVGVGSAKIGAAGISQARTIAAARARAEIAREMSEVVKTMVSDYSASGGDASPKDALAYQEVVTQNLAKANLSGSVIIEQDRDNDDNWWCVVSMSKASVAKEINQAQAAAKLAVPKASAIDAQDRMDKAFDKALKEPVGFSSN